MDKGGALLEGLGGIQDCRERPVAHANQRERPGRCLWRCRGNGGHRVPDLADPAVRQHALILDGTPEAIESGHVAGRYYGHHTRQRARASLPSMSRNSACG